MGEILQRHPALAGDEGVAARLQHLRLHLAAAELLPGGPPHPVPLVKMALALLERAYEARRDPACLLEMGK